MVLTITIHTESRKQELPGIHPVKNIWDKTNLIACTNGLINIEEKFICASRPRRFGKPMTLKLSAAYYSRSCDSADRSKSAR